MKGIAHFNDNIRDGLKGSVFEEKENGFINGKENMEDCIKKVLRQVLTTIQIRLPIKIRTGINLCGST